jgi:Fe-S cluster biogenesis protein NfuA
MPVRLGSPADEIKIKAEVDRRDPSVCRFMLEHTLYIGTKTIGSKDEAQGSPLTEKLFEIEYVTQLQLIGHLLVVTRSGGGWEEIVPQVKAVLTAYFISGLALTREEVEDRMMLIGRSTTEKIQYLLDRQISPGIADHGGFVNLVSIRDNIIYLRLGGGCQGCGAADFTLRQGIESILKQHVPEIVRVVDLTDHTAGLNPYYQKPSVNHDTTPD